jgi:hypothetical protein
MMVAAPLIQVSCAVCAGRRHQVICAAHEIRAQSEYLRWFHRRRLRSGALNALADAPLGAGKVDCVAIWNTFDQLPDPAATLAAARWRLRPDGLLVLRVPNGECFRRATAWMRRLPHPLGGWLRAAIARTFAESGRRSERILPPEFRETGKVAIRRTKKKAMLDGESRKVRIGHQIGPIHPAGHQ